MGRARNRKALARQFRLIQQAGFQLSPQERNLPVAVTQTRSVTIQSIIPPADEMEALRKVDPTFPDRLLKLAEGQSLHRQNVETTLTDSAADSAKEGRRFAFVLSMAFLAASVWLGLTGHDALAGVLGGSTMVGLVTVFIKGKGSDHAPSNQRNPR